MIRHCVLVKFRPEVDAAARQALYDALKGLDLPGLLAFNAGPNVSPEGLGQGFADGFTIDFLDVKARDAYLANSEHRAIGARIVAAAKGGPAGLLVFDLAC